MSVLVALHPAVAAVEDDLDRVVLEPASSSSPQSGVPVHSAVLIASPSQGMLRGRGLSQLRPLPAHSSVTGSVCRGRARISSSVSSSGLRTRPPTRESPRRRVELRDVEVDDEVVEPGRGQVVPHRLERRPAVAERELELLGQERPVGRLERVRRSGRVPSSSSCPCPACSHRRVVLSGTRAHVAFDHCARCGVDRAGCGAVVGEVRADDAVPYAGGAGFAGAASPHTRKVERAAESRRDREAGANFPTPMGREGLEPSTLGLRVPCSAS